MIARENAAYLFLSLLQARLGSSVVSRLGESNPAGLLEMPASEVALRAKLTEKGQRTFKELKRSFDAEEVVARLVEKGVCAVTFADEDYPERLTDIPDPPSALFVKGSMPSGAPTVVLVGSRKASVTGVGAVRVLGRALGEWGVCVVSGLALGLDAAAHEGALKAGGPTVGVIGCGIEVSGGSTASRRR